MNALYVAIGGALGTLARYGVSRLCLLLFPHLARTANWSGTLIVNVLGSFFIAFFTMWFRDTHPSLSFLTPFLIVGFCGGFTTFSTFALDGYKLWIDGSVMMATIYIILSLVLSVLALLAGFRLGEMVATHRPLM